MTGSKLATVRSRIGFERWSTVDEIAIDGRYEDEHGRTTARLVEPHVLAIHWPAWYVIGHDHMRRAVRTFRIDRLRSVDLVASRRFRARPAEIMDSLECRPAGGIAIV